MSKTKKVADAAERQRTFMESNRAAAKAEARRCTVLTLLSPNGKRILAVQETIHCCSANVSGFTRDKTGALQPEYSGDTDVNWDGQESDAAPDGSLLVEDEAHDTWPLSECHVAGEKPKRRKKSPAEPKVFLVWHEATIVSGTPSQLRAWLFAFKGAVGKGIDADPKFYGLEVTDALLLRGGTDADYRECAHSLMDQLSKSGRK